MKLIYHRRGGVPPFVGPFMDGPRVMIVHEQDASGGDEQLVPAMKAIG